jgi:hypothetical protein
MRMMASATAIQFCNDAPQIVNSSTNQSPTWSPSGYFCDRPSHASVKHTTITIMMISQFGVVLLTADDPSNHCPMIRSEKLPERMLSPRPDPHLTAWYAGKISRPIGWSH